MNIAEEIDSKTIKKVIKALEKKAIGYETEEVTEEYAKGKDDQEHSLIKRKVTKHYVPADISAAKLLLEISNGNEIETYINMTDKELDEEAIKLFKEYQELADLNNIFNIKGENKGGDD